MGLVNINPLLPTNHDSSILPSIKPSYMQVQEPIILMRDPRRVPYEYMHDDLTKFLAKKSNI